MTHPASSNTLGRRRCVSCHDNRLRKSVSVLCSILVAGSKRASNAETAAATSLARLSDAQTDEGRIRKRPASTSWLAPRPLHARNRIGFQADAHAGRSCNSRPSRLRSPEANRAYGQAQAVRGRLGSAGNGAKKHRKRCELRFESGASPSVLAQKGLDFQRGRNSQPSRQTRLFRHLILSRDAKRPPGSQSGGSKDNLVGAYSRAGASLRFAQGRLFETPRVARAPQDEGWQGVTKGQILAPNPLKSPARGQNCTSRARAERKSGQSSGRRQTGFQAFEKIESPATKVWKARLRHGWRPAVLSPRSSPAAPRIARDKRLPAP